MQPPVAPFPRVPGYRVHSTLHSDALSQWFEAEEESGGRRVMLRLLRPGLAGDEGARQAFLADAEKTARIRHRNLLGVLAVHPGHPPHLVTEASSRTLADELATGWPLGEAVALAYARDLAAALAQIDAHGLAHRNLAPSMVHLLADGTARLMAAGELVTLKALAAGRGRLTQDARYAAPELIAGSDPVDGRSASYMLGGLLFHMMAGSPPHPASTPLAMARAHLREEFPALADVRPDVTPAVAELCRACTRRAPDTRPAPAELMQRLDALQKRTAARAPAVHRRGR